MTFSYRNCRGVFGFLPCSHDFPMGFLSSSPSSQVVPQDISNNINSTSIALQFYLIWFCPQFNSHGYKLKRWVIRELICFYFATGVQRCGSIGECPMTKLWALSKSFLEIWTFGLTQFWDLLTPKKLNWILHLLRAFQHYAKIEIHLLFQIDIWIVRTLDTYSQFVS
jgi:hypothetical protein